MYVVSSTDKVSDLIESMFESNGVKSNNSFTNLITTTDSLLFSHLSNYPRNILFNKDVFLIRNDSTISVNLFDYYMFSNTNFNPILQEGDIINIKESNRVAILGEVNNPKRIKLENNLTYRKLIELAGGVNNTADKSSIKIVNYNSLFKSTKSEINRISKIDSRYRSDFDESFLSSRLRSDKGVLYINNYKNLQKFLDTNISKGDIIIIPHKVDYIEIIGGLSKPGTYKFNSSMNVNDYLILAGGFSEDAKNNNIYLIDNISGFKSKIKISYKPKAGDVIFIEEKVGFKSWERFSESIKLGGTLSTMLLVFYNIWDKLESN
jgi:protein involved in polysaccharide export with SLBB domain